MGKENKMMENARQLGNSGKVLREVERRKSVGEAKITNKEPFNIEIPKKIDYKKQGKRNKAMGADFERRTRKDLEEKGWKVSKYSNNVQFER